MAENQKTKDDKKPKHRSPNYPYCSLKTAIDRAAILKKESGHHPVGFQSAKKFWKYGAGTAASMFAALKSYGLGEISGEGDKRYIQLTERARRILADTADKADLLKQAALNPPLYRKLWDKFGGDLPPSDKVIEEYLEFDLKFNPVVMAGAIADFRETIGFADLSSSDTMDDGGDSGEEEDEKPPIRNGETNPKRQEIPKKSPVLGKGVILNITIDVLENGQIDVNSGGGTLTAETFAIMQDVLELKSKHEKIADPDKRELDHDHAANQEIALAG